MKFSPERLIQLRTSLQITKAEAARRLNISPMAYGRYEKESASPPISQYVLLLQTFHCNVDFLYGLSMEMKPDYIMISRAKDPELYNLFQLVQNNNMEKRLLAYAEKLLKK